MANPLLMMLVACDRRRNPAIGLAGRAASDFGRAFGRLCTSIGNLCESSPTPVSSPSPNTSYATSAVRKPLMAVTAGGRIVDVSGGPGRPASAVLSYSKMQHRTIPDYAGSVRAAVAELGRKYNAQQSAIREAKTQIDSHGRIDLEELDRKIGGIQEEIDKCQTSEDDLHRLRRCYREEGLLRYVFVHGLSLHSLSRQVGQLREKRESFATKLSELKALVAKHNSFDFAAAKLAVQSKEENLESVRQDYWREKNRLDDIDRQMKHFMGPLSDTTNCLNLEIDKYNALSQYAARLDAIPSAASDAAYRRRLVHQECEAEFGDGRVGQMRSRVLVRIRKLIGRYDNLVRQAKNHARAIGLQ